MTEEETTEKPEEPRCEPVAVLMCTDRHRNVLVRRLRLCVQHGRCCRGCDGRESCRVVCGKAEEGVS